MSRKRKWFISLAMLMCVAGGFVSCQDDIAESDHYKSPDWLKGNAYEVLQQEGKYKSFLKAVDYSDYRQVVAGKTIVTVMAPDDDAFCIDDIYGILIKNAEGREAVKKYYEYDGYCDPLLNWPESDIQYPLAIASNDNGDWDDVEEKFDYWNRIKKSFNKVIEKG